MAQHGRSSPPSPLEAALQRVPFLSQLTDRQIQEVASAGTLTSIETGQLVFAEGDAGDRVYVILTGSVRVARRGESKAIVLASLGAGSFFGEIALLDGGPRSASVETLEACRLFSLDRDAFFGVLTQSTAMLAIIFTSLTTMVRQNLERAIQEEMASRLMRVELELGRHRALSLLVSGVAHEINTPLGTANTAASLVKRALSPEAVSQLARDEAASAVLEDVAEGVALIERNIARAHRLVQEFKKVSVGHIIAIREQMILSEAVIEILDLFRISAQQARLQVTLRDEIPAGSGTWLGYLGYLSQIITNLLTNVERYAYPSGVGGPVEITLLVAADSSIPGYVIRVRDFGAGIPPENLARVFEPFFTTGRKLGGTGLGLAIVYNLVIEALHGTIDLRSTVGEGTDIWITLPQNVPELPGVNS